MTRRRAGMVLLLAQVALMGSLGLKLVVDRARLPRAWARTLPFDPSTPLRGRYVRLAVEIPMAAPVSEEATYAQAGVRLRQVDGRLVGEIDSTADVPRVQLGREGGDPGGVVSA